MADEMELPRQMARTSEQQETDDELTSQTRLADVGELVGPVLHSVNNFLNVVMLHIAVMEQTAQEGQRAELSELRRQGTAVAALVKRFQKCRRQPSPPAQTYDLNVVIQTTLEDLARSPSTGGSPHIKLNSQTTGSKTQTEPHHVLVEVRMAPDLPRFAGFISDVKRLLTFLVMNAATSSLGGMVTVRTEAGPDGVRLHVEDTGETVPSEEISQLFEPEIAARAGRNPLELAACKSIVTRLQGRLQALNRPEGGMAFVVELPIVRN
jgi:signal transduction histidine kinase